LPIYQKLGDVRELVVCRNNIALTLLQRGCAEDAPPALDFPDQNEGVVV
jgi:hypothetical protein